MPKINSLKQILARARLDAKRAVKPVKQSKAKALTDNPDWQAQYLAEFNQFYADKISTQNDTDRKNDSIKKQQLIAKTAKNSGAFSGKMGLMISDQHIEKDAQKYGEYATTYIQNYKDEYQRTWNVTTIAERLQAKAKANGYQAALQSCLIDEERLVESAEQYGELAELYIQTYKDAYHGLFDNKTPEQKVEVKAKKNGKYAARQLNLINEEQLKQSAEQYGELAELYIQTYKDTYHLVFDNMTPEQKVIAKAKINGNQLACKGYPVNEERLATTAIKYGEFSEIYVENYKNFHKTYINKKRPLPENAKKLAPSKRARLS